MKISIIIPTYNCGNYIRTAIDSVLQQPYPNKELIVIDGKSSDATLDILRSYGTAIRFISEKDNGQGDAINKGFALATGDIVTWLNADDYYEPNIFTSIYEIFKKNPTCAIVYGRCNFVRNNTITNAAPIQNINLATLLRDGNHIFQPASFYRKQYLAPYAIDTSIHFWMEYDMFIHLLRQGPAIYVNRTLANFTVRDDQKSNQKNRRAMAREIYRISVKNGGSRISKLLLKYIYCSIIR